MSKKSIERLLDGGVVSFLILMMISFFPLGPLLEPTHVAGGDMVSHPYAVQSLLALWKQGRLWGWSPGWFGGFPFPYFYFSVVYSVVATLHWVGVPSEIAFKLTMGLIAYATPIVFYGAARIWAKPATAFFLAALGTAGFLNEALSISGGTLKSLLAGQSAHQVGLLATVLLAGMIIGERRFGTLAILATATACLSHGYSALLAGALLGAACFAEVLRERKFRAGWPAVRCGLLGIGISAVLWIPFVFYREWTLNAPDHSALSWGGIARLLQWNQRVPATVWLGATGLFFWNTKKKRPTQLAGALLGMAALLTVVLLGIRGIPVLQIRLVPEINLLVLFALGAGLRSFRISETVSGVGFAVLGGIVLAGLIPSVQTTSTWWKWNFSGLEAKPRYSELHAAWKAIEREKSSDSRVAVEYADYGPFGSPRVFELTPAITGRPILEGLLLESSSSPPFYYYASKFMNLDTWWPGFEVSRMPDQTLPVHGIELLSRYHVQIYLASSARTRKALDQSGAPSFFENESFKAYRVNRESSLVSALVGDLPVLTSRHPLLKSVLALPRSMESWTELRLGPEVSWPAGPAPKQELRPIDSEWEPGGQALIVHATGATAQNPVALIFKIPYFPNWKSSTGDETRLVSPNLILVRTEKPSLRLSFETGWAERIGTFLSLVCLVLTFWLQTFLRKQVLSTNVLPSTRHSTASESSVR